MIQDEDRADAAQRRQPVRHQERRAAHHQPLERVEDDRLCLRVDRRCRLVEDEDRRVLQERAGHGDALAFASRQLRAALAKQRVVLLRQRA